MKKIFLFACVALLALASCSKEPAKTPVVSPDGETDVVLGVGADSRYIMGEGGLGNVNKEKYSVRYILEIYKADDYSFVKRYERFSDIGAITTGTQFHFRISLNEYQFVLWADFVPKVAASGDEPDVEVQRADAADVYYKTTDGLRNVSIIQSKYNEEYPAADSGRMVRDAYSGSAKIDLFETAVDVIQLRRPFTRVEIWSYSMTDQTFVDNGLEAPKNITVNYTKGFYNAFDVLSQDVIRSSLSTTPVSYSSEVTQAPTQDIYNAQMLAFDYIFAPSEQPGETGPVKETITLNADVYGATSGNVPLDLPLPIQVTDRSITRDTRLVVIGEFFGLPIPSE